MPLDTKEIDLRFFSVASINRLKPLRIIIADFYQILFCPLRSGFASPTLARLPA